MISLPSAAHLESGSLLIYIRSRTIVWIVVFNLFIVIEIVHTIRICRRQVYLLVIPRCSPTIWSLAILLSGSQSGSIRTGGRQRVLASLPGLLDRRHCLRPHCDFQATGRLLVGDEHIIFSGCKIAWRYESVATEGRSEAVI